MKSGHLSTYVTLVTWRLEDGSRAERLTPLKLACFWLVRNRTRTSWSGFKILVTDSRRLASWHTSFNENTKSWFNHHKHDNLVMQKAASQRNMWYEQPRISWGMYMYNWEWMEVQCTACKLHVAYPSTWTAQPTTCIQLGITSAHAQSLPKLVQLSQTARFGHSEIRPL